MPPWTWAGTAPFHFRAGTRFLGREDRECPVRGFMGSLRRWPDRDPAGRGSSSSRARSLHGYVVQRGRAAKLALCRHLLEAPPSPPPAPAVDYRERYRQLTGRSLDTCPVCGGRLMPLGSLPRAWYRSAPSLLRHLMTGMQLSPSDYGKPISFALAQRHRTTRARAALCAGRHRYVGHRPADRRARRRSRGGICIACLAAASECVNYQRHVLSSIPVGFGVGQFAPDFCIKRA